MVVRSNNCWKSTLNEGRSEGDFQQAMITFQKSLGQASGCGGTPPLTICSLTIWFEVVPNG